DSVQFLEPKNNNKQNNQQHNGQTQTGNNPFDNTEEDFSDLPF
ncbi:single-stranded DNA-binding protein, partial [Staphylococcus aureus]|nr:single-stranded DNA-binding protein [Staphylococcus aureus]MDU0226765.1 single-stranded DNA-binding protein [Staphylococcus aureus]